MPMWEQAVHFNTGFVHDVLHDDRMCAKSLQLCLTLCDTMDCSPPGSSVHRTLQARILEWVAMSFSRGSSQPRDRTCIFSISCFGGRVLYHYHRLGSRPQAVICFKSPLDDSHV